ncbi:carboxypeptidase-like regulatory domain-containing protein [Fibrobacter succinogenes]|uniref:carboxypeptidase-like regulatory domain-containing protein n=1 Tax=Fibrobacter succinogenes TaxID=833 RepID=UPI0013D68578|nr:carboxypeptidase-like regulatory domain-containing protein [Fibrobacter succinogenes]
MKKWVWHIGFAAAVGALIAACSSSNGTDPSAGTSLETENSVAVVLAVKQSDGSPAARTKVLVRPVDFLAGANNMDLVKDHEKGESPVVVSDSTLGILNLETDEQGRLNLKRLKPGTYNVEARQDTTKAFVRVVVTDVSRDSVSIKLEPTGAVSGQVYVPENENSLTVGVKGLDYFVETDEDGKFEFKSLPKGLLTLVGFSFHTYKTLDMEGKPTAISNMMTVGSTNAKIEPGKTTEVTIGQKPVVAPDTTAKEDVYPVVLFENFEDSVYGWYTSVSKYATAELDAKKNVHGRKGLSAHFVYTNDSNANWALMGHDLNGMTDMSELDSVVFWARSGLSDSSQWISVSFDVLLDSIALDSTGYENGKAWVHMQLDTAWQRYVVTPEDLIEPDEHNIGGNIGWDEVKEHVTNLNFFGGGVTEGVPYEMWVDDIVIYGVKGME